jgi:hypothetical protein
MAVAVKTPLKVIDPALSIVVAETAPSNTAAEAVVVASIKSKACVPPMALANVAVPPVFVMFKVPSPAPPFEFKRPVHV